MKINSCIYTLVLITFVNAAPYGSLDMHYNYPQGGGYPAQIGTAFTPGYNIQPATIPQPPQQQQQQAAGSNPDTFAYLGTVPVVGNILATSSPQALKSVENAMPAKIELPQVGDT